MPRLYRKRFVWPKQQSGSLALIKIQLDALLKVSISCRSCLHLSTSGLSLPVDQWQLLIDSVFSAERLAGKSASVAGSELNFLVEKAATVRLKIDRSTASNILCPDFHQLLGDFDCHVGVDRYLKRFLAVMVRKRNQLSAFDFSVRHTERKPADAQPFQN